MMDTFIDLKKCRLHDRQTDRCNRNENYRFRLFPDKKNVENDKMVELKKE